MIRLLNINFDILLRTILLTFAFFVYDSTWKRIRRYKFYIASLL